jgi:hypothetical protein
MQQLLKARSLLEAGSFDQLDQFLSSVDPSLRRLMLSGGNLRKALAGADETMLESIELVRETLDRRIEKSVRGLRCEPSSRFQAAARSIRCGELHKLKLLHLMDEDDTSTRKAPLAAFASLSDGKKRLEAAFARLQAVVTLACPEKAADAIPFLLRFGALLQAYLEDGATWDMLGKWYKSVVTKVSNDAVSFSANDGGSPGPTFKIDWLNERSDARETLDRELRRQDREFMVTANTPVREPGEGKGKGKGESKPKRQLEQAEAQLAKAKKRVGNGGKGGAPPDTKGDKAKHDAWMAAEKQAEKDHPDRKALPGRKDPALAKFRKDHPAKGNKWACWHAHINADSGGCIRDACGLECTYYHP